MNKIHPILPVPCVNLMLTLGEGLDELTCEGVDRSRGGKGEGEVGGEGVGVGGEGGGGES